MIIQWILQTLACAVVGCIIGYFGTRITTKLRVFLFRKRSNRRYEKELEQVVKNFYKQFGFYYEDVIKYAPELDVLISSKVYQAFKDDVEIKMFRLESIDQAIKTVEQIDIMKFKQTIENIKNQKSLENIN